MVNILAYSGGLFYNTANVYIQVILASIVGGIFSLTGGLLLLWREEFAKKFSLHLLSFAAGSMIAAAFLGLIPEATEISGYPMVGVLVVAGILVMFVFEKTITWYHCHDREHCNIHTFSGPVILGDTIHNFVDGIAIALSFSVGPAVGVATTIAIFF
ncbi:MAG: ZIP family metal transporter, partial [Candidatus Liptonbacteria bacterium]